MPLDRHPERTITAETSPQRIDTQDEKNLDELSGVSRRSMLVTSLLAGAAVFAAACASRPEGSPETRSDVFKFERLSLLSNSDFTEYAGVEAQYTLSENLENAQLVAEDENGRVLHQLSVSLGAGEGKLVFFEQEYQNSSGHTDAFVGASETRLIKITGKDSQGNNIVESIEIPAGLLD